MSKASGGKKSRQRSKSGNQKPWKREAGFPSNNEHMFGPDLTCVKCGAKLIPQTANQRAKSARPCIK